MILIVDDEPSSIVLLDMILRRDAYFVRKAMTGREALRLLEREDEQECELIITDIRMPEMDGKELVAQLRANPRTAGIPVIMCTSTADRATVLSLIGQGVRDYIVKPVSASLLLEKVRGVLESMDQIIEARSRTIVRHAITPGEYRPMAIAATETLEEVQRELEFALRGRNGKLVRAAADRIREPASWFGAKRTATAIRGVVTAASNADTLAAAEQLVAELNDLRAALRIAGEMTA